MSNKKSPADNAESIRAKCQNSEKIKEDLYNFKNRYKLLFLFYHFFLYNTSIIPEVKMKSIKTYATISRRSLFLT